MVKPNVVLTSFDVMLKDRGLFQVGAALPIDPCTQSVTHFMHSFTVGQQHMSPQCSMA